MVAAFKETDLGPPVVAWLAERGWDVYQEVTGRGGRADIVATLGRLVAVVELKKSLGLDVLEQGSRWIGHANIVWVGVPYPRHSNAQVFARSVAEWRGFGVLYVDPVRVEGDFGRVKEAQHAPLQRGARVEPLRAALHPGQKAMASAGSARGGYWTPFKGTCQRIADWVRLNPGSSLKEVLARVEHHYSTGASARAHMSALIEKGVVAGVALKREGKAVLLYPSEAK